MDVKSSFFNEELKEVVYVKQLEGFLLSENVNYFCKLKKALYGLKQAPIEWFSRLDKYLKQHGYRIGAIDSNLYIKFENKNMIIVVFYVDDVIFGSDLQILSVKIYLEMKKEFEMSMLGELTLFLGLQVSQLEKGFASLKLSISKIC